MHKFRHAAKTAAWYSSEDDSPNYNPFRKIRSRPSYRVDGIEDVESGLHTVHENNHSENCVTPQDEIRRRSQYGQDGPPHANTFPPNQNSPVQNLGEAEGSDRQEKSQDSAAATSETIAHDQGNQPRKRRNWIRDRFPKSSAEKDPIERTPTATSKTSKRPKPKFTFASQIRATILNSWINVLLVFAPIGIALNYVHIDPVGIFVINFIAIIPLAAMLSYATEEIALRTGETLGGLLNATFGNAVELIVSILALTQNQIVIVQTSLIGSMLSNLLLVMGMCFFFGGINRKEQFFNVTVAQTAASLLALAIGSLIIPAAFNAWANNGDATDTIKANITELSRGTAVLLLVVYACYLVFQLKTHADMYNEPSQKVEKKSRGKKAEGDANKSIATMGAEVAKSMGGENIENLTPQDPEEQPEEPQLAIWVAIFTLAISTVIIALCAEYMTEAIKPLTADKPYLTTFIGLIVLPIVGNAAEHATAVTVACKDKMDLAIGVAVGSSMQIALLVLPFVVVLGWMIGNDAMNLDFDGFQVAILFVAVLLVNYLIQDGKSHWLEGVLLQTLYLIIAIAAWFYPAPAGASVG